MTDPIDAPTAAGIEITGLTRRFRRHVAVADVSLAVPAGTTCGLIGLNGAGKTTLITMLVGLLAPTSGSITVAGHAVPRERDRIKNLIGYVPDRPNVYPWMRVGQAIQFCRALRGQLNETRVADMLRLFRLDTEKRVKQLSKGMAAKLSLLLAMAHDPQVLILDEPTSGLDPLVHEEFIEGVLAATVERQQTVLLSSHTLADVQRLADDIALMHEGKLLIHGKLSTLLETTKRIRAVLDETGGALTGPSGLLWQQVRGREWLMTVSNFSRDQVEFVRARNRVSHVDVEDMNLDDVFKDLIRGRSNERAPQEMAT